MKETPKTPRKRALKTPKLEAPEILESTPTPPPEPAPEAGAQIVVLSRIALPFLRWAVRKVEVGDIRHEVSRQLQQQVEVHLWNGHSRFVNYDWVNIEEVEL